MKCIGPTQKSFTFKLVQKLMIYEVVLVLVIILYT